MIQVYRSGTPGESAARAFRAALPNAAQGLEDRVLDGFAADGPGSTPAWDEQTAALVLWLDAGDLDRYSRMMVDRHVAPPVFLSSTLAGGLAAAAPFATASSATMLVYPWPSPQARDAAQSRTRAWLQRNGFAATDDAVQVDTFFALSIVGDVLSHILDSFSREYFVERVEHAVQQSLVPSSFPHVSLGPDQRFAAKGSYVVRLDSAHGFSAVSGWIVP
jgi:hypothetical protein